MRLSKFMYCTLGYTYDILTGWHCLGLRHLICSWRWTDAIYTNLRFHCSIYYRRLLQFDFGFDLDCFCCVENIYFCRKVKLLVESTSTLEILGCSTQITLIYWLSTATMTYFFFAILLLTLPYIYIQWSVKWSGELLREGTLCRK